MSSVNATDNSSDPDDSYLDDALLGLLLDPEDTDSDLFNLSAFMNDDEDESDSDVLEKIVADHQRRQSMKVTQTESRQEDTLSPPSGKPVCTLFRCFKTF